MIFTLLRYRFVLKLPQFVLDRQKSFQGVECAINHWDRLWIPILCANQVYPSSIKVYVLPSEPIEVACAHSSAERQSEFMRMALKTSLLCLYFRGQSSIQRWRTALNADSSHCEANAVLSAWP
jgi:hypothetical protein